MRTIYAHERSTIDIPSGELVGEHGQLKLRSDILERGLVDVAYVKGKLKLRIHGVVGLLPVTDKLALDVSPKFPVSNLNRIVYVSDSLLFRMPGRHYDTLVAPEYLPVPLVRAFVTSLKELLERGIHRAYMRQSVSSFPRPRINFRKTHQRYWSRSDRTHAVVDQFVFTQDNLPNQCLKLAATKALALSKRTFHLEDCVHVLARGLRQMSRISAAHCGDLSRLSNAHRYAPRDRRDYVEALVHAIQLIRNVDHSLDRADEGALMESYVVTLDDAFEKYIRNVLATLPSIGQGPVSTVDGNAKRHQRRLFRDNARYKIKPDLVMKDRSGIRLIGDVKYRLKPHEDDRYQIIAHALSYGTSSAVLVYPKPDTMEDAHLRVLGTIGSEPNSVAVYEYYFDLAACLNNQEALLRQAIVGLLGGRRASGSKLPLP